MTLLRPLAALWLSLVLALTGGTMAAARGQAMAAGSIVICTGTGPVHVAVDRDGRPIGPVHICPDCALSLFDTAAAGPGPAPVPDRATLVADHVEPSAPVHAARLRTARARAPPVAA